MQIYIRRDNEEFGPYSQEAALEYVKQGIFGALDLACYAGTAEWKTVGELLGIEDDAKPERTSARRRASHITEFNPTGAPAPVRRRKPRKKSGLKSLFMILLNGVLLFIVLTAAYIRWGGGARVARPYLLALSVEIAQFANSGLGDNPATASESPAPVTANPPAVTAPTPPPASTPAPPPDVAAAATPELVATPPPSMVSASTPQLVASAPTPSTSSTALPSTPEIAAASTPPTASSPDSAPASSPAIADATPPPSAPEPTPEMAGSPTPDTTGLAVTSSPPPASSPAPDASATPAPESTPAPTPAPPAPPAPPKPFDPAEVAANPREWPKTLKLKQAVTFPVVINAQVVGSVTVPPGADATMVAMQGDQLTLQCRGMTQTVSWKLTDLKERVEKAAAMPPPAPPVAPLAPATPTLAPDAASTPAAAPSPDSSTPSGN